MREQLGRVRELNQRALELERQIILLVIRIAPSLLAIPGCGALTAAKIVGESAGVKRFRSKSAYARWNGTAPSPSGRATRAATGLRGAATDLVSAMPRRITARTTEAGGDRIAREL